jgi:hypothetical protein
LVATATGGLANATRDTNALISWFGKDRLGFVGLWRGPSNTALASAPVVRLNPEGIYAIVAATIPDYILVSLGHDEFAKTREVLTSTGFAASNNSDAIWASIENTDDPNTSLNRSQENSELRERIQLAIALSRR